MRHTACVSRIWKRNWKVTYVPRWTSVDQCARKISQFGKRSYSYQKSKLYWMMKFILGTSKPSQICEEWVHENAFVATFRCNVLARLTRGLIVMWFRYRCRSHFSSKRTIVDGPWSNIFGRLHQPKIFEDCKKQGNLIFIHISVVAFPYSNDLSQSQIFCVIAKWKCAAALVKNLRKLLGFLKTFPKWFGRQVTGAAASD